MSNAVAGARLSMEKSGSFSALSACSMSVQGMNMRSQATSGRSFNAW
jgi:hypothetical protein